ncbi:neutral zinc metallopeptidase [Demequina sp.]|uniref:KPN_02809 family neutral zinc metallopeptidase n=1 Tax=Demequina sp. TaxID=2050685 RepID=UPI0025C1D421|nr:neutral zinc metallopeptidase [Demequina sp.]
MTFNEGTRLDPNRVQRRGPGGARGGIAIGGGIGGVVIVILALILGIDPSVLSLDDGTRGLGGAAGAQDDTVQQEFAANCTTGADANADADCRVLAVIESLDAYWSDALPAAGFRHALPGVVIFDQSTSSACGMASSATGPFYCPPDQTMYVDTTFFDSLASFGFESGNLAEAYVIAHEYGHHIENELGVFDIADRSGTGANSDSVKVELMADCLAGVWVGHAATTPDPDTGVPFLEPISQEQLDNALAAAASVGDDRIQEATQGEVDPHTFTHGTSEQRTEAFVTGYTNGTVASCDAFGVLDR